MAMIKAKEGRDVTTCDIPNAFIQTTVEEMEKDSNRTIMKIPRVLVDILCEVDPVYKDFEDHINGLLVSAMLFYKKLVVDLMKYRFKINPYDPCVASKMTNGKQLTVSWPVDDLKASHMDLKIIDRVHPMDRGKVWYHWRSGDDRGKDSRVSWYEVRLHRGGASVDQYG
jgi:hypothetical protein